MNIPHFDPSRPRILVTGAAGLLGRHVVDELCSHGATVRGFGLTGAQAPIEWVLGDILDLRALQDAVKGCFAVVHLAARPNIWSGNENDILHTNTIGTWNVFRAAEQAGIRRVVLCSSDSVMGYTVREGLMIPPDYLPVDGAHPLRPTDPYALSKKLGEEIARYYALRGTQVVAMRTVFVAYPEMEGEIRVRAQDPENYRGRMAGGPSSAGGGALFNHIDPRDLAHAFWLALNMEQPGTPECPFEAFYLAGRNTLAPEPTVARLQRLTGHQVEVRDRQLYEDNPHASAYDLTHAKQRLGFVPRFDQRHLCD